jgi:hypothetical protein
MRGIEVSTEFEVILDLGVL